ncbi:MAG: gamma-glutamylcyclotransferase family protein, partial [Nanoarchaeota archaeon]
RGVRFVRRCAGALHGWRIRFARFADQPSSQGYAVLERQQGAVTWGIVYEVDSSVQKLDTHEHVPYHYIKQEVQVMTSHGALQCMVFLPNRKNLICSAAPAQEYLAHLLAAQELLPASYLSSLLDQ